MTKAMKILEGVLVRPVTIGASALFFHGSEFIRTSKVVEIQSVTEEEVCFETLNTKYRLLTGHTYEPGPAVSQYPMLTAA